MSEKPQKSFFQRFRLPILIGAPVLIVAVVVIVKLATATGHPAPRKETQIVSIKLPPLPPPPPPPPPPQMTPPPEKKMEEQQPVDKPEDKPKEKPPEEPAPLATNLKGDGPSDGFGLGAGSGNGGGLGSGGGGGSKWGWYASQVQSRIADVLRGNARTRSASMNLKIRVWADAAGRITRVSLAGSSGDVSLDKALQNEILAGLKLQEPPPAGMPMPIVMHVSAKRP